MLFRNRYIFRVWFFVDLFVSENKCDINSVFDKKLIEFCFIVCMYIYKKIKGCG